MICFGVFIRVRMLVWAVCFLCCVLWKKIYHKVLKNRETRSDLKRTMCALKKEQCYVKEEITV